ncbi:MAG: hypothetical protein F4101_06895 [Nitrospira sp. SB0673_bin_12]|nr:hypothetical protein [Nitrospira sp. SB0673_bin_12]
MPVRVQVPEAPVPVQAQEEAQALGVAQVPAWLPEAPASVRVWAPGARVPVQVPGELQPWHANLRCS